MHVMLSRNRKKVHRASWFPVQSEYLSNKNIRKELILDITLAEHCRNFFRYFTLPHNLQYCKVCNAIGHYNWKVLVGLAFTLLVENNKSLPDSTFNGNRAELN